MPTHQSAKLLALAARNASNVLALEKIVEDAINTLWRSRQVGWFSGYVNPYYWRKKARAHIHAHDEATVRLVLDLLELAQKDGTELDNIKDKIAQVIEGNLIDINFNMTPAISKINDEFNARYKAHFENEFRKAKAISQSYQNAKTKTQDSNPSWLSRTAARAKYQLRYMGRAIFSDVAHFYDKGYFSTGNFLKAVNYLALFDPDLIDKLQGNEVLDPKDSTNFTIAERREKLLNAADILHTAFESMQKKIHQAAYHQDLFVSAQLYASYIKPINNHNHKWYHEQNKFLRNEGILEEKNFNCLVLAYINGTEETVKHIETELDNYIKQYRREMAEPNNTVQSDCKKLARFERLKYDLRQLRQERKAERAHWNKQLKRTKSAINRWMREDLGLPSRISNVDKEKMRQEHAIYQATDHRVTDLRYETEAAYAAILLDLNPLTAIQAVIDGIHLDNISDVTITSHQASAYRFKLDFYLEKLEKDPALFQNEHSLNDLDSLKTQIKEKKESLIKILADYHNEQNNREEEAANAYLAADFYEAYYKHFTHYEVTDDAERFKYGTTEEQQVKRRKKGAIETLNRPSGPAAVGEGFAAAIGAMAFGASVAAFGFLTNFTLALLLIGLPGFICNYLLLRSSIKSTGKSFFLFQEKLVPIKVKQKDGTVKTEMHVKRISNFWIDENGDVVSSKIKVGLVLSFFIACAVSSGLCYAVLSFLNSNATIAAVTGKIGVHLPTLFAMGLSALPPIGIAIGLTSILVNVLADFIKNKRWRGIAKTLYSVYIDHPWREMSKGEIARECVNMLLKTALLALCIAINVLITIWSLGFFHAKAISISSTVFNLGSGAIVSRVGHAVAWLNAITWLPAQGGAIFGLLENVLSPKNIAKFLAAATIGLGFLLPLLAIIAPKRSVAQPWQAISNFIENKLIRDSTWARIRNELKIRFDKIRTVQAREGEDNQLIRIVDGTKSTSLVQMARRGINLITALVKACVFSNAGGQAGMGGAGDPDTLNRSEGMALGTVSAGLNSGAADDTLGEHSVSFSPDTVQFNKTIQALENPASIDAIPPGTITEATVSNNSYSNVTQNLSRSETKSLSALFAAEDSVRVNDGAATPDSDTDITPSPNPATRHTSAQSFLTGKTRITPEAIETLKPPSADYRPGAAPTE